MPKLPYCDRCLYFAFDYHLICTLHPAGSVNSDCPDYETDPNLKDRKYEDFLGLLAQVELTDEEQWQPEGARFIDGELVLQRDRSFYCGEEIMQPQPRWTQEEMFELIDEHPIFTGRCPACEMPFPRFEKLPVHWDCECGWKDDSI